MLFVVLLCGSCYSSNVVEGGVSGSVELGVAASVRVAFSFFSWLLMSVFNYRYSSVQFHLASIKSRASI